MTIALDRRTRRDCDVRKVTPSAFFAEEFLGLAAAHGELVAKAMRALDAQPLAVEIGDASWTVARDGDGIFVRDGIAEGALIVTLSPDQFSDWAQNQTSFNGFMTARNLSVRGGGAAEVSLWDSLWLGLLEGWPAVDDTQTFVDRHGAPLDLAQSFTDQDDPADIRHFLREAGFLRLRGWLDPADMDAISADMDRVLPDYVEGDGKSWWATLADGSRVCVRLQEFVEHSPTTARILSSERWDRLRTLLGGADALVRAPVGGRIIEALVKPVGVVSGPSDLSFHRDCHLGRHAYKCATLTIGVSLSASGEQNGGLRVIAGSHRVAMPVEIARTRPYLPVVALDTEKGDLTVHLSCTLHEATAPKTTERRVMYTDLTLEALPGSDTTESAALLKIREQVSDLHRDRDVRSA
ncbi:hypothetical protein BH10PSE14_BH10PSE14_02890 [soil metagenome]